MSARGVYEALVQPGRYGAQEMRLFARLFMSLGHPDQAREILVQAFYMDPTDRLLLRMALPMFTDMEVRAREQRHGFGDDLLAAVMLAAASAPEDYTLLFSLARYLGSVGRVEEAAAWGTRAIELFPVEPSYYQPVIDWHLYLGDREAAARLQERLAALERIE